MRINKGIIYIYFFTLLLPAVFFAQGFGSITISDPVSSGMGNTYTSNLYGVYAVGKNPANIILDKDITVEIATILPFPNMGIYAGTDFINMDEINYFFGGVVNEQGVRVGRYLTEADKDRLKGLFKNGGIVSGMFSASLLNVVVNTGRNTGTFGFSINENAASFVDLPESIVNLALDGNDVGDVYNFGGSRFNAVWMRDYTFSYSRDFRELFKGFRNFYIGASVRFIQGFAMVKSDYVNTSFETGEESEFIIQGNYRATTAFSKDFAVKYDFDETLKNAESNFSAFPSPSGSGVGLDLGISAQVNDKWRFAAAITGIGQITWNKNVAEYSSSEAIVINDLTDDEELDSLFDKVKGEGRYINEVQTELPLVLRLGATLEVHKLYNRHSFPGTLIVSIDYNQGFNHTALGTPKGRVSVGAEWRPSHVIPIRTGFSVGGRFGFAWSFGTGVDLGLFEFNISAFNFASLLMVNNAEKVSLAIGSSWKF